MHITETFPSERHYQISIWKLITKYLKAGCIVTHRHKFISTHKNLKITYRKYISLTSFARTSRKRFTICARIPRHAMTSYKRCTCTLNRIVQYCTSVEWDSGENIFHYMSLMSAEFVERMTLILNLLLCLRRYVTRWTIARNHGIPGWKMCLRLCYIVVNVACNKQLNTLKES